MGAHDECKPCRWQRNELKPSIRAFQEQRMHSFLRCIRLLRRYSRPWRLPSSAFVRSRKTQNKMPRNLFANAYLRLVHLRKHTRFSFIGGAFLSRQSHACSIRFSTKKESLFKSPRSQSREKMRKRSITYRKLGSTISGPSIEIKTE